MTSLYKIDNEILQVLESCNPTTGEIDAEAFDTLALDRTNKQQNVILFVKDLEVSVDAIEKEVKRLNDMKKTINSRSEWLKNYLKDSMEKFNETELTFGVHKLKIKTNPPSLNIIDSALIPGEFKTQIIETTIDKNMIKAQIKLGIDIPGACLTQSTRLEIN